MADEIDWRGVREAYEAGEEPLRRIRARFGVGVRALRERRIAEGWTPRSAVPADMARVRLAELKRAREGQERANPNTLPRLRTGQKAALTRKKTARLVAALKTGGRRAQKARERLEDAAGMGNEAGVPGTGDAAGTGGEMGAGRAGRAPDNGGGARAPDTGGEVGAPDTGGEARAPDKGRVRRARAAASKPPAATATGARPGRTSAPSAAMRLLALVEGEIDRLEELLSKEGRIVDETDFRMLGEAARMLDRAEALAGRQARKKGAAGKGADGKGADGKGVAAAENDDVEWMRAELERRIESLAGRARPSGSA
ncbi:hypothetical protein [Afifella sp. IM 167]|uniref:hypothetical protein n=1 Tax=Afifella sp. IM 167 TaxID=2033586 RepID=UPI001CCACF8D|nr:hypothetical protein [Afifella sp. IM 167]MBZ8135516.1 hypothetical protein [Afifella sp. IM 167]